MPLINKQPFKPEPIPDNLRPDDEVFYLDITNEIFTSHDAFFDRFLFCNSLIWTCSRTGKSGLTYKEALDSEQQGSAKKKKGTKRERKEEPNDGGGTEQPVKKKKKKYPYDPKKYSMPVPEGFDPALLTPTGKIDGRKLKSKKNKELAEELLQASTVKQSSETQRNKKKKTANSKTSEDDAKQKEENLKKKIQMQAELAKERELDAKRKKEAAAMARQLERQKREEERKKAAAFLQNWEKKCEDLERDDLRRLPQPTPLVCDIPDRLFGDALFIMESLYNLHDLYQFDLVFPEGLTYDMLEEMLLDRQEEGPLDTLLKYLLKVIFSTQPTGDGYGLDDDPSIKVTIDVKPEPATENINKINTVKIESTDNECDHGGETNGMGSEHEDDEEIEDKEDKDVNMNDLIGSAIKAAQEVKKSLPRPLPEMELNSTNVTEILRLHLLQSGSFPKGRTIYNGWYSSREDPGLWLCMQEPDLIKKLGEVTIYDLSIEERIKIIHTLIYQLFTFIKTRNYIESATESLTELRKTYRQDLADFARWDRENCVKRLPPPKRKGDANVNPNSEKPANGSGDHIVKTESVLNANSLDVNVSLNDLDHEKEISNNSQLKSCLKANGTSPVDIQVNESEDAALSKKKITFKTGDNGAIQDESAEICHNGQIHDKQITNGIGEDGEHQSMEELERAYQQNLVDYEDYQRERAIKQDELNQTLIVIRTELRKFQSIYGIHPIGRDRAYKRYWLFQSLPGLFVEHDDDYMGRCLSSPTPLESRYKKLFNKENPLMHQNEDELIRIKTCDAACSTNFDALEDATKETFNSSNQREEPRLEDNDQSKGQDGDEQGSDRFNGDDHDEQECEPPAITDEMNYCTADENTCAVHGKKRPNQIRWWFYHTPESIDNLMECLNKRGHRESELLDVLTAESSIIKPWVADCPAYKLNKFILEQSGIRRSRRLRVKGKTSKRRARNYD